jgi:hypothetical protein
MCSTAQRLTVLRLLAIAALAFAAVSCDTKCGVADDVTVLDARDGVYLVYRVSGAHDKAEFFEVYQSKPAFDSCGSTETPAIARELYERSQGFLRKVELHGNRLEIVYTHNPAESIEPSKARLSP